MGAYTTLAVNEESYNRIVSLIRTGYTGKDNVIHRPAPHMACCLVIQANLGCRFITIFETTAKKIESTQSGAYSNLQKGLYRKRLRLLGNI